MRLKRMGQKKAPFYRIVVADSRSQEMEDSSRKLVTMILTQEPSTIKIDEEALRSGYLQVLSQPKLLVNF